MATTIHFADEIQRVKSKGSQDGSFGVGGVYSMRQRHSKSSLRSKDPNVDDEDFIPEGDEDSGLRAEGDYKNRQVDILFASCLRAVY